MIVIHHLLSPHEVETRGKLVTRPLRTERTGPKTEKQFMSTQFDCRLTSSFPVAAAVLAAAPAWVPSPCLPPS